MSHPISQAFGNLASLTFKYIHGNYPYAFTDRIDSSSCSSNCYDFEESILILNSSIKYSEPRRVPTVTCWFILMI